MKKSLSGFDLKIIGIIFMLLDHINIYLGEFLKFPSWISLVSRFVAPLFVFLLIEGFYYTRSRKKYFFKLFYMGIFMYLINMTHNILINNTIDPFTKKFDIFILLSGHNIFMTLALLLLFIWIINVIQTKSLSFIQYILLIISLFILLPFILFSEGGIYEIIIGLIFYVFRNKLNLITIGICLFSILLFIHSLLTYFNQADITSLYQVLTFSNEFMIITVLPFIYLYNGERGGNGLKWQKSLFYYFYPVHLIILYGLNDLLL